MTNALTIDPAALQEGLDTKRESPSAKIIDDISAAQMVVHNSQNQRAAIEAFLEQETTRIKENFDRRNHGRDFQITALLAQVEEIRKAGNADADDMRATVRDVTKKCEAQIAAADKRITAHLNIIQELQS